MPNWTDEYHWRFWGYDKNGERVYQGYRTSCTWNRDAFAEGLREFIDAFAQEVGASDSEAAETVTRARDE